MSVNKKSRSSDEIFIAELHKGYEAQLAVANLFLREGVPVHVPKLRVRPEFKDRGDYKDGFDLKVGDPWVHIEVKSRDLKFSGLEDYPYPDIFVETRSAWNGREETPAFFIVVSQHTGVPLVLDTNTSELWAETTKRDRKRGYTETFITAPKELWEEFEWLLRTF